MKTAMVAVVLAAMAVTSASLVQTPTYEASAHVWVGWQNSGEIGEGIRTLEYREPPTQEIVHTFGIRSVSEDAIQRLGLQMGPAELLDNLSVEQVENTSFIVLTYEDTDPYKAKRIVNAVGEVSSEIISERSSSFRATVWEKATAPENPVSPCPWRNGLLTLVIGLVLCAGGFVATPAAGG